MNKNVAQINEYMNTWIHEYTYTSVSKIFVIRYKPLFDHTNEFYSRLECTKNCCTIYASSID
jgi:hypothetical protein